MPYMKKAQEAAVLPKLKFEPACLKILRQYQRMSIFHGISAFSFTDLRFPGIWEAKQEFASTSIERCTGSTTANEEDTALSAIDEQSAEKVQSSTAYNCQSHVITRMLIQDRPWLHGQRSETTAPSDRPTVQNNTLLDTLPWNRKLTRGWLRNPTSSVHLALYQLLQTLTQMC
ncbi:hypothetical protein D6D13_09977 [Aureobasidium pullulans]|uniref:Uncharacterized protein n=1 Tax=Aureobasidium pullulans TaxID=5580 RepID=A0A4S9C2N4_AURPU|nr:hypothetical protein D6D13_09977 [Aureobasidium pullulans]